MLILFSHHIHGLVFLHAGLLWISRVCGGSAAGGGEMTRPSLLIFSDINKRGAPFGHPQLIHSVVDCSW